jgi:hypothetical protein
MKISELPEGIKERALAYQRKEIFDFDKYTDSLFRAFSWHKTTEGYAFWQKLHEQCLTK